ncbi:hypothetical protein FO519_008958 [Halicephalobus sp. NKZ332]|nr:hypothetical protein FO519_008958 [Halicephalobus sp. NKZ332]
MDSKENILNADSMTDEILKENKFTDSDSEKPYIPSELTFDIGMDSAKWSFPLQDNHRYIYVFDDSMKIRIFDFIKNHGRPAYRCLGCRYSDSQKHLVRNCSWSPGDLFPSSFVPPPTEEHVCQPLTEEEAGSRLSNLMKDGSKPQKQQKENTVIFLSNDAAFTPEPHSARFSVLDKSDYISVYDENLRIRIFRFYRFFNKKLGYRCTGCGALNKNLVRYCSWPEGSSLPESFNAPKTEDHVCEGMTEEDAQSKVQYLIDFNNGIRAKKRPRENDDMKHGEQKKPKTRTSSRTSRLHLPTLLTDSEVLESDVTSEIADLDDSINKSTIDEKKANSTPANILSKRRTSRRKSLATSPAVSSVSRYNFPVPNDDRFVIVRADNSDRYWPFRLQYKRRHAYYSCLNCLKLKRFVSFGVTNGIDQVKDFTGKSEHACKPLEKTEAEEYCNQVANIPANKKPENGNEEMKEDQANQTASITCKSVSNLNTEVHDNEDNETPAQPETRVVEDSDVLPFLIKEPHNPSLVRRFIGSSTGLLCQFCNENKNQVVGRFSGVGKLVITGTHLPACRPFNLEENSNSVACQTDKVENKLKEHEHFEIEGNLLKISDREYFDPDGDGKMYYCKTCFKKGKTVVEAKIRTIVVEDDHCRECLQSKKCEIEPVIVKLPPRSARAKSVFPSLGTPTDSRSARATSCAPVPRRSLVTFDDKQEQIPENLWKIVSNGRKDYLLVRSSVKNSEGWEFRNLHEKQNGMTPYLCCDCGKTCFSFAKAEKNLYSTSNTHSCRPLPFKILERKYEDMRAGIKVNQAWWKDRSREYGEKLINRGSGRGN